MTKRVIMHPNPYNNDSSVLPVLPPRVMMPPPHAPPPSTIPLQPLPRPVLPGTEAPALTAPSYTAQQIIERLTQAIAPSERWQTLQLALQAFSHTNVELHDYEMNLGADKALCLKLGYVVVTNTAASSSSDSLQENNSSWNDKQIVLICRCLSKIYQCSINYRIKSFREIGVTDLVPLLIQVWKEQQKSLLVNLRKKQEQQENNNSREPLTLVSLLEVLRIYAKLDDSAKSYLIGYENGILVTSIMKLIFAYSEKQIQFQGRRKGNQGIEGTFNTQQHFLEELLGMIKDLTFRSRRSEKEFLLTVHGGITKQVIFFICGSGGSRSGRTSNHSLGLLSNSRFAELVTAILWNLALSPSISIDLLRQQQDESLLIPRALCTILSFKTLKAAAAKATPVTAGTSTSMMTSIKTATNNTHGQVAPTDDHDNNKHHHVLDSTETMSSSKARRNAISALGNLVVALENQKILFRENVHQELQLIPTFMNLIISDPDSIVRRRAMRTLRCLASSLSSENSKNSKDTAISKRRVKGPEEESICPYLGDILLEHGVISFLIGIVSTGGCGNAATNGGEEEQDDDNNRDTIMQACQAIAALIDGLKDEEDWLSLEMALTQRIEVTTDSKLTLAACQCLLLCASKSPYGAKSEVLASFSDLMWKRLETVVTTSKETHSCISKLLLQLARREQQQTSQPKGPDAQGRGMTSSALGPKSPSSTASTSPTIRRPLRPMTKKRPSCSPLACSTVVNMLTLLLSEPGSDLEESRNDALEVVLVLVQDNRNRRPLAENEGLLTALVNLCLLQPGPTKKDLAKQVILDLVPEL